MLILPSANQVFFQAIIPGSSDSGSKLDIAYIEFANGRRVEPIETNPETLHLTLRHWVQLVTWIICGFQSGRTHWVEPRQDSQC
jgi:hypothetical protein